MKLKLFFVLLLTFAASFNSAASESMPSMPKLAPKKVYTIKDNENLESQQGFGDKEQEVRMMNLMMVEGSGYEGMDMDGMKVADNNSNSGHSMQEMDNSVPAAANSNSVYQIEITPNGPAKVGTNSIAFSVKKDGKEMKGLKIKSQVYMTNMDMGTEQPKVKELAPGKYNLKASFAMRGPWAVKLIFADSTEKILNFEVNSK